MFNCSNKTEVIYEHDINLGDQDFSWVEIKKWVVLFHHERQILLVAWEEFWKETSKSLFIYGCSHKSETPSGLTFSMLRSGWMEEMLKNMCQEHVYTYIYGSTIYYCILSNALYTWSLLDRFSILWVLIWVSMSLLLCLFASTNCKSDFFF